jgi:hypothetical protein
MNFFAGKASAGSFETACALANGKARDRQLAALSQAVLSKRYTLVESIQ